MTIDHLSIVVHDPHPLFVEALGRALDRHGCSVTAVRDPREALAVVARTAPDVCIVDASGSGTELASMCEAIRAAAPGVAIMALSGGPCCPWQLYDDGVFDAVVSKACGTEVVAAAIRQVVRHERTVVGYERPARAEPRRLDPAEELLTRREREVLELLVRGFSTRMMAGSLEVSENTVRTHVQNVLSKLGVNARGKAARVAVELDLVG